MGMHMGFAPDRNQAKRRVKRARHEGVRRHAAGLAIGGRDDNRDARREPAHDPPEMGRLDLVDLAYLHQLSLWLA